MNIDWSKAPEGATHKDPDTDCFYKLVKDIWHMICGDGESVVSASLYNGETKPSDLIGRPNKQDSWYGEGLPPVGTVCEVLWNESRVEYLRTKVFGVNEHGQPIHRFDEGPKKYQYQADVLRTASGTQVFRPIRTAEQVAAEEREKAIEEMVFGVCGCEPDGGNTSAFMVCGFLYDAGYRKQ